MRIENQPYGRLSEIVNGHAFTVHPYKHPTIGTMADLEAASLDDVREFYRTYYVPANATVVIAGDIDSAPGRRAGDDVLRPDSAGLARAVPRDIPAEPPQTGRRGGSTVEEGWPLPVVVVAHHVTFDGHPDSYPLQMAVEDPVGRAELAPLPEAGVRDRDRAVGGRRRPTSSSIRTSSMPSPSCSPGTHRPRRSRRSCRNSTGCGPSPCRSGN